MEEDGTTPKIHQGGSLPSVAVRQRYLAQRPKILRILKRGGEGDRSPSGIAIRPLGRPAPISDQVTFLNRHLRFIEGSSCSEWKQGDRGGKGDQRMHHGCRPS